MSTEFYSMIQITPSEMTFSVIRRLFDSSSREQCVMLGMICWSLWNRRNNWVWEKANGSAFGVNLQL